MGSFKIVRSASGASREGKSSLPALQRRCVTSHGTSDALPADPGAQVLDHHPVVGPGGRAVLVQPWSSGVSPSSITTSVPVTGSVTSGASCVLNRNPFSQNFLSIELIDCVISITMVIELNKSKSLLDQDVRLPAIAFEEPLQILLPAPRGQVPNVDPAPASRHLEL